MFAAFSFALSFCTRAHERVSLRKRAPTEAPGPRSPRADDVSSNLGHAELAWKLAHNRNLHVPSSFPTMNEEQGPDVTGATVALGGMEMENSGTPEEPEGKEDSDEWSDCTDSEDELPGEDDMWRVGLVEPPSIPESLNPEFFPSKVGGDPAWLDPENLPKPAELRCQANVRGETCGRLLTFLLQIYAPVYEGPADAFHRSLFVFVCANPLCVGKHGSCRVFRSQLPRCVDASVFRLCASTLPRTFVTARVSF